MDNIKRLDFSKYGLIIKGYEVKSHVDNVGDEYILNLEGIPFNDPDFEQMQADLEMATTIRESTDLTVQDAYQQLLTVMALTHGRPVPATKKKAT